MSSSHLTLSPYLEEIYDAVKAACPGEGRRKWRLRVAEEFWTLPKEEKERVLSRSVSVDEETAAFEADDDPLDDVADEDAPGLGLVIRTDFSDENAWEYFVTKLKEGEAEFTADSNENAEDDAMDQDPLASSNSQNASSGVPAAVEDEDSESEETPSNASIFAIINPDTSSPLRSVLTGCSNLSALKLFNSVNVRRTPPLPPDTKRHRPANRLIDHDGWQEIYEGKMLWIYDAKSNKDACVRVVSQAGAGYGTATADSWRARVTHICELQVNLASGAMSIDFGGLDRYDYEERLRNLQEAEGGVRQQ
ncbi:hypothetical protein BXZ70DRAFT_1010278 [Cristinia sonorae]|uniref:Uncharacterized protein n=1 Tax=Cristinia sonorae TaxID=1940300 RepID=A0A8K0ULB6_9AGAR|nr:hypothetical protein BXZ70DRAFT_1010278 [Cristinia sonorae]